jgi:hypothetical protein
MQNRAYCFRSSPFPNDLISLPADSIAANESFWEATCFILQRKFHKLYICSSAKKFDAAIIADSCPRHPAPPHQRRKYAAQRHANIAKRVVPLEPALLLSFCTDRKQSRDKKTLQYFSSDLPLKLWIGGPSTKNLKKSKNCRASHDESSLLERGGAGGKKQS